MLNQLHVPNIVIYNIVNVIKIIYPLIKLYYRGQNLFICINLISSFNFNFNNRLQILMIGITNYLI